MSTGLNVSRVVNVSVNLTPNAVGQRNFGAFLVLGSSNVIDTVERIREFDGIDSVAAAYGTTAPEYQAFLAFFSQKPQPQMAYGGRWAQVATGAILHGAILTPAQQLLVNYTSVTAGAFFIVVDGVPYALTGLNFSSATNLNGVASIIQAALVAAGATNARVIWGAINQRFDVISGTTGTTSTISYGQAPTARTSVAFSAQPTANATLTLNGTALTFVSSAPATNQILIGTSLAATLTNLAQGINSSVDTQVSKFTAFATATTLYLWSDVPGAGGNSLTVSASSSPASNATVSASPMSGGAGTDVSVLLGLSVTPNGTGANANPPVPGLAAETLLSAVNTLMDKSGLWYCLEVATATPPSDADHQAAAVAIEAAQQARIYGITTQNTTVLDSTRSDDLASVLKSLGLSRTFVQYSSTSPYAAASLFGRFATINYGGSNTTITGKFKTEPTVIPELLSASQADTLEGKNANVFVTYQNDANIIEQAVMSNGYFMDEQITADWFQNAVQVDIFKLLQTVGKVPQTDDGQNLILGRCNHTSEAALTNGWVAPGIWNADGFGSLAQGDKLQSGYYWHSDSYDNGSQADREARKAMPVQGAVKLAGAIHSADVVVLVNR